VVQRFTPVLVIIAVGVLLTWPLALAPGDALPQGQFTLTQAWTYDLLTRALVDEGRVIGFTDQMLWPWGGYLAVVGWQYILPLLIPALLGLSIIPGLNLLIFGQLLAAALALYALSRRLGAGAWPAAMAGIFYGFHPFAFHQIHNGQLSELCHWGLPLLALLLLDGAAWKPGWRSVAIGLVLGLTLAASPYSALAGGLLCVVLGIWALVRSEPHRRRATTGALAAVAGSMLLGALPFLYYYLVMPADHYLILRPNDVNNWHSGMNQDLPTFTSLAGWFVPYRFFEAHWRAVESGIMAPNGAVAGSTSLDHAIGLVALALAVLGLRRRTDHPPTPRALPTPGRATWMWTGLLFGVAASGYALILYPHSHFELPGSAIPLPASLPLALFPKLGMIGAPYRLAPGVLLVVAVLAAQGLTRMTSTLRGLPRAAVLAVALVAVSAEGAWSDVIPHPLPMQGLTAPQVYRDLARSNDDGGVLTIPWWPQVHMADTQIHLSWQRVHRHPIHVGEGGVIRPEDLTDFTARVEAIGGVNSPLDASDPGRGEGVPARWIVVHEAALLQHQRVPIESILTENADLVRRYDDDNIQLWEVRPRAQAR